MPEIILDDATLRASGNLVDSGAAQWESRTGSVNSYEGTLSVYTPSGDATAAIRLNFTGQHFTVEILVDRAMMIADMPIPCRK